ncbi:adenosine receptor A3-like [Amphiura filiformis]|uniref:adenosine receptor A3-like n=1 Tax=Amphiura filiformis TaxID=82378 RepID=UPI003B20DF37
MHTLTEVVTSYVRLDFCNIFTMNHSANLTNMTSKDQEDYISTESLTTSEVIYIVGLSLNSVAIITLNTICLLVLRRTKEIHHNTKLYMMSLTLADFCLGCLTIPIIIYKAMIKPFQHLFCLLHVAFVMTTLGAGLLSLMAVTVERYLHISRPLHYEVLMTKTKVLVSICFCWMWPALLMLVLEILSYDKLVYNRRYGWCWLDARDQSTGFVLVMDVSLSLVPFIIIVSLYIRMLSIARSHTNRMQERASSSGQIYRSSSRALGLPHFKALKTFLIVTLAFCVTYTPMSVLYVYENLSYSRVHEMILYGCIMIMFVNHWLNSVVYYFKTPWFKLEARRIIHH